LHETPEVVITGDQNHTIQNNLKTNPQLDKEYQLPTDSPLRTLGKNGTAIGLEEN